MSQAARRTAEGILAEADIRIGGDRPWDLQVHEPRFFARVLAEGSLGFGEAYMDGWWDCEDLGGMTTRAFTARLEQKVRWSATTLFAVLHSRLLNRQKKTRAVRSGGLPYRFGDDLFEAMLDPRLCYSCAYFGDGADSDEPDRGDLARAQEQKLDLVCRKVGLRSGDRVLDIGCGWGSFAGYAAERYGARVLGVNVSHDQLRLGRLKTEHLEGVDLRFMDYRDLTHAPDIGRPFDHVVSIGMFEHVGVKNYRSFFRVAADCLADDGLFLLHTIGRNHSVRTLEPWIDKYVFPNCQL
ncbi:MAG: class I SAM-dependent methyltransferase, partial [Acidobacteriota bacterium]